MNESLTRADRRAKDYLGGPGLGALALIVVAAVVIPVSASAAGWSTFSTAAVLYSAAIVAATIAVALRDTVSRAVRVAAAGTVAVLIVFVVGFTGIFTMSENFRWSGLSAVTGMVLGSLAFGALVRRK
ncbi:hypothetical protein [Rhodococcoides kroppenstedtii]|uniref:hypothetical protein n=1 Tax=Rhodococcoides kroppenstedtii TaxID=293050 RepID=UPI0028E2EF91|nr:hypothetical protein [Rhodococcus kroppenstedtii]